MISIGQAAEAAGLRPSALRYYEQEGLLPPASRQGGKRMYDPSIVGRLEVVKLAQRCGFRLPEIKRLLDGFDANTRPSERWKRLAMDKERELTEHIRQLTAMRNLLRESMTCDCLSWEECYAILRPAADA